MNMVADGTSAPSRVVGSNFTRPTEVNDEIDKSVLVDTFEGAFGKMSYTFRIVRSKTSPTPVAMENEIKNAFEIVTNTLDNFNPDSELNKFNALKANVKHEMSTELSQIMDMVLRLEHVTRGSFDPAYSGNVNSSFSKIKFLGNNTITKMTDDVTLDLGGIAKGWFLDFFCDRLKSLGVQHAYLDWSGDIKVIGHHPSGRNWTVSVHEPPSMELIELAHKKGEVANGTQLLEVISLLDGQALTTSGDWMQVHKDKDGELRCHIVDPKSGEGMMVTKDTLCQASVVSSSAMISDALATCCIVKSTLKESRLMLESVGGALKESIDDFLLYIREGPQIVRHCLPGQELERVKKERLSNVMAANVIVVGGGLAGFSAAIEAANTGAKVTILEKEERTGGNSAKATSGINGWGTKYQVNEGIEDHEKYYERDVFRSGIGGNCDLGLVRTLSTQSRNAIHWLSNEFGIDLSMLSQLGGHSRRRTHRVPPQNDGKPVPVGYFIMKTLREHCETKLADKVKIITNCRVTSLIYDVEEVEGNKYKCVKGLRCTINGKEEEKMADSVVLATGGFGHDSVGENSLMRKHRPELVGTPTTNGSCATGDGMKIAMQIGASVVDMDKVQLHPTGFIDPKDPENLTKYLAPEAVRGSGGLLLNQSGKRFINELELRSVVSKGINSNCDVYPTSKNDLKQHFAWCIMNDACVEKFGLEPFLFYKDRLGLFDTVKGYAGIASLIGCEASDVLDTLKEYQNSYSIAMCPITNKNVFPSKFTADEDAVYYVARVTPSIHYCMGGIQISPAGEVQEQIESSGVVFGRRRHIRHLFAAGEVTGGVHGENRLGGNSLLECVVFGRIAGERAATILQKQSVCLTRDKWQPCTLREIRVSEELYGHNTVCYRFNLHGAIQRSGLKVGQFVAIRGELDGATLVGYYSPITRPTDEGVIGILCRDDGKGGPIVDFLQRMRPGSGCFLKAMGGFSLSYEPNHKILCNNTSNFVSTFGLLAGGTGIAPMVQIVRAYLRHILGEKVAHQGSFCGSSTINPGPRSKRAIVGDVKPLNLIYAAEEPGDLAFVNILEDIQRRHPKYFRYYLILNKPPLGWCGGVGFVNQDGIKKYLCYPPADDQMIVICGPPIFEKIMTRNLDSIGFKRSQYYAFSQDDA